MDLIDHIYILAVEELVCLDISWCVVISLYVSFKSDNEFLINVDDYSKCITGITRHVLDIAKTYSTSSGSEKEESINLGYKILKKKNLSFAIAQIFFFIGTFAYSLLFLIYEVIPVFIGWFGVIASLIYGIGNIISLMKPASRIMWAIGGLLILVYETVLGGCLIIISLIII